MKNRVAGFLLVIAKVGKNADIELEKTSRDVMEELIELKEYVRCRMLLSIYFAHVHLKLSCCD